MFNPDTGCFSWLLDDIYFEIFSYLTLGDLKQLRLTCKSLSNLVFAYPAFSKRYQISINAAKLHDISDYVKENEKRLNFRNVKLEKLCDSPQLASIMAAIGEEVLCLQLDNVNFHENLTEVPNLRELTATDIGGGQSQLLSAWRFACCNNLRCLNLKSPGTAAQFTEHIFRQLIDAGKSIQIQRLSIVCNHLNEAVILEALRLNASTLRYLEVTFERDALRKKHYKAWTDLFQSLYWLETLKLSGALSTDLLEAFVKALPQSVQLKCIELKGLVGVCNEFLGFIACRHGCSLRDVDLPYCAGITDDGLEQLQHAMPSLKRLNLHFCRGIQGDSLTSLVTHSHVALRELSLCEMRQLKEDCICKLAENIPNLVSLDLQGCIEGITDKSLAYIFRHQTGLRFLNLFGCIKITDTGLMGLGEQGWPLPMPIRRLKRLNTLDLSCCRNLTDRTLIDALVFKELRKLNLTACTLLTTKGIECLVQNCPAIEDLNVSQCTALSVAALDSVAVHLKRLLNISIDFQQYSSTEEFLQSLQEF